MVACNDRGRCMKNTSCNVKTRIENSKSSAIHENSSVHLRMARKLRKEPSTGNRCLTILTESTQISHKSPFDKILVDDVLRTCEKSI